MLKLFVVEREVPGIGAGTPAQLCAIARRSKEVLDAQGVGIQWIESYVAGDRTYCVYRAESEALIREHAARSGFPANRIVEIRRVLDPTMAGHECGCDVDPSRAGSPGSVGPLQCLGRLPRRAALCQDACAAGTIP